jgi:hypothetical protein
VILRPNSRSCRTASIRSGIAGGLAGELDGCSTGKQSAFLGQNHAEEAFLRWSDMRSGYSLLSLSSRI